MICFSLVPPSTRRVFSGLLIPIVTALGLLACPAAGPAGATPRYAARYEQNCVLCHVNPTGGGQRSLYAAQYLVPNEIAAVKLSPERLALLDPQVGKGLSIGCDLRTIHHLSNRPDPGYDGFLEMQGTVELAFQPTERFFLAVNQGLSGTGEVYGMALVLPYSGYLKAGRFAPAYGWKFEDHTMFVRQKPRAQNLAPPQVDAPPTDLGLGGRPIAQNDVGLEAAVFPGRLALIAALLNGNAGSDQDNNRTPAYDAQMIYRLHLAGIGAGIGGSFWLNSEIYGRHTAAGPYGYLTWKRLAWLGELDWSWLRYSSAAGPAFAGRRLIDRTGSQELSLLLTRGVTLTGTFDIYDPDLNRQSGSRSRSAVGVEAMVWPFLVLYANVGFHHFQQGSDVAGRDYTQSEIQVHFLY